MKKNADLPASPCGQKWKQQNQYGGDYVECSRGPLYGGLTKREHFAAMAMQGILASRVDVDPMSTANVARVAVFAADALLAKLEVER